MMAYPPNAVPGGRDVKTFYSSIRVYGWGLKAGEKILFVHGDATPSLIFKISQGLVDARYRVMLFGKPRELSRSETYFFTPTMKKNLAVQHWPIVSIVGD